MEEIIKNLSEPLPIDEIELRVGTINTGGYCEILVYKTARADVARLNKVCGLNWKNRHYFDENKSLCCGISIFNGKEWVERVDVGSESNMEKEKGSYSDSFKRAGFRWGIGLELYRMPKINIKLESDEFKVEKDKNNYDKAKPTWKLKVNNWSISYEVKEGIPCDVVVCDETGRQRFPEKTKTENKTQEKKPQENPKTENKTSGTDKPKSVLDENIADAVKVAGITNERVKELCHTHFQKGYGKLTTVEKQSLLELIKREAEK